MSLFIKLKNLWYWHNFRKAWRRLGQFRIRKYRRKGKISFQIEYFWHQESWCKTDDKPMKTLDEAKERILYYRYEEAKKNRIEKWKSDSEEVVWEHP